MATQSHGRSGFKLGTEPTWILFRRPLVTTKHKPCSVHGQLLHLNIESKPWLKIIQGLKLFDPERGQDVLLCMGSWVGPDPGL